MALGEKQSWKSIVLWILPAIAFIGFVLRMVPALRDSAVPGLIMFTAGFIFAMTHGSIRYGIKNILVAFVICLAVTYLLENISIMTGFPFGHYHYASTSILSVRLYKAPLFMAIGYFSTAYPSWVIANILLDRPDDNPRSNYFRFALPVIAAFILVMWDIVLDPCASTIDGAYVWHEGGGFFGVPLSNFLGWYLCVWLFFQLFALYLSYRKDSVKTEGALVNSRSYLLQPVTMYLTLGLMYPAYYIAQVTSKVIVDRAGQVWHTANIYESSMMIFLFTMFFVSVLAAIRVFRRGKTEIVSP